MASEMVKIMQCGSASIFFAVNVKGPANIYGKLQSKSQERDYVLIKDLKL